jgi:hypothetical protein
VSFEACSETPAQVNRMLITEPQAVGEHTSLHSQFHPSQDAPVTNKIARQLTGVNSSHVISSVM